MPSIKRINKFLTILIGLFFLLFIYDFVNKGLHYNEIKQYLIEIGGVKVLVSCLFYLFSHLLRALRITVMLEEQNYSLSNLIRKQYYTNAINIIIPFKLGELYRIMEINKLVRDFNKTFITIVAERSIDFFILFCGLFISLLMEQYQIIQLRYTVGIGVVFIISVLFIYFVLPENIKSINLFLAKRHKGFRVISFLAATSRIYNVISQLREIFRKRYSTIILLSFMIWASEILGFIYVFDYLKSIKLDFLLAFMVFLSSLMYSSAFGFGGFNLAFYTISTIDSGLKFPEMAYIYQLIVFAPAVLIGILIYIYLLTRSIFKKNSVNELI